MNEPHIWWYVTRASSIIAWVLLTGSVVLGILLSTRVMRKIDNPAWLQDLHRYISGLALIFVILHMVSLMLDDFVHFSLAELLIPGATAGSSVSSVQAKTLAVTLGVLAFYLMAAVQVTSWFMNKLPRRFWKGVHYSAYGALVLVTFHAAFTGTDVSQLWYKTLSIILIAAAAGAILVRVIVGNKTRPARSAAADAALRSGATVTTSASPRPSPVVAVPTDTTRMRATETKILATGVLGVRFVPVAGGNLDVWHPGAHITLYLPSGLERQYSLCGDPADRGHFDIAVLKKRGSTGGSKWIHENMKVGTELEVSAPRNHFDLEPAAEYVFVAGGIGITPIKAMIESLPPKRKWQLHYFGRSRTTMAFAAELEADFPDRVFISAADERDADPDLRAIVAVPGAEVYCCGPEALMSTVAAHVPEASMHLERFVAVERATTTASAVVMNLKKSHRQVIAAADESLLDALVRDGVPIMGSCKKGLCGTCEVRVLDGQPEHLDSIMDDAEKDELHVMYPCVSRSRTPELTLDL
ncbi:MAG: 2Fe-2S iron-sulfur cluster binding domain-containing protein [Aurantimicrobium sp.]|nr:2Fe-2S iron-sulfur cluster binding domain-containing protein [Aurantimicrobium sp.]